MPEPRHEGARHDGASWPLAVSSLGMPGAPLPDFLATALAHGCTAVELRVADGEATHLGLTPAERQAVRRACAERGLGVISLASYVKICAPGDDAEVVQDLCAHLELAADLGAPGVRVFPGGAGDGQDDARARGRIAAAAGVAQECGVRVLVETHDSHPRGADVARVLDGPWPDGVVGAIWDAAHPWVAGEEPAGSWRVLAPWLASVQIKDLAERRVGATPALVGHGVLPWGEITDVLRAGGYAGPMNLEWEKPWHDGLPELNVALGAAASWLSSVASPHPDRAHHGRAHHGRAHPDQPHHGPPRHDPPREEA